MGDQQPAAVRDILRPDEVAEMLAIDIEDVEHLHRRRKLIGRKTRGKLRFHRIAVEEYLSKWAQDCRTSTNLADEKTGTSVGLKVDAKSDVQRARLIAKALKKRSGRSSSRDRGKPPADQGQNKVIPLRPCSRTT